MFEKRRRRKFCTSELDVTMHTHNVITAVVFLIPICSGQVNKYCLSFRSADGMFVIRAADLALAYLSKATKHIFSNPFAEF